MPPEGCERRRNRLCVSACLQASFISLPPPSSHIWTHSHYQCRRARVTTVLVTTLEARRVGTGRVTSSISKCQWRASTGRDSAKKCGSDISALYRCYCVLFFCCVVSLCQSESLPHYCEQCLILGGRERVVRPLTGSNVTFDILSPRLLS